MRAVGRAGPAGGVGGSGPGPRGAGSVGAGCLALVRGKEGEESWEVPIGGRRGRSRAAGAALNIPENTEIIWCPHKSRPSSKHRWPLYASEPDSENFYIRIICF